jgi:hypothetical protein
MIGKAVLPYLGGTPQVWNSCMVFFQAALLAGYLYSHKITQRFGLKKQLACQLVLLLLPLIPLWLLKLDVGEVARDWIQPPSEANPIPWLLAVLALVAGLPFFVVATSAPLLQKWYADTGAMSAKDPYFLYGASNLGSMLALVGYPTLIEPKLTVPELARYWVMGYGILLVLTLVCGLSARLAAARIKNRAARAMAPLEPIETESRDETLPPLRPIRWILLAFVPSSLMLGVTTYVTTDIASVPLLWIIGLTLYLLTFILVFTRLPRAFNFLNLALLVLCLVVLFAPIEAPQYGDGPISELPLAKFLPLQLGPVLSQVLAVKHVLIVLIFSLACLLAPRLTHAVMVLLLPVLILVLLNPFHRPWHIHPFIPDRQAGEWAYLDVNIYDVWNIEFKVANLGSWQVQLFSETWHWIALNFLAFFVAAMVCHGELARTRPATRYLTGFYLCMSIGGVLGGLFNAVVAPLAFDSLVEYPLVIAGACLLMPQLGFNPNNLLGRLIDLLVPAAIAAFGLAAAIIFLGRESPTFRDFVELEIVHRLPDRMSGGAEEALLAMGRQDLNVLHKERGFFGVIRVRERRDPRDYDRKFWQGTYHFLQHGHIDHGMQRLELSPAMLSSFYAPLAAATQPLDAGLAVVIRQQVVKERRRDEPIAYFQNLGPIGDIFRELRSRKKPIRIGVLGMGTGTLAGYAEPGWQIDYFEIDPAVVRLAYDERYFTYLPDAERRGVKVQKFLGDGRLQIQKNAPEGAYDVLFMDAFSSDSVPVHLLTRQAAQMYLTKLAPDGIIVFNIANRYLDFKKVFGNLAEDLKLASLLGSSGDAEVEAAMYYADLYYCDWIILARKKENFGQINALVGTNNGFRSWREVPRDPSLGVWTDDFSNLLSVFYWGR